MRRLGPSLGITFAFGLGAYSVTVGWGLGAVVAVILFAICGERRGWLNGF